MIARAAIAVGGGKLTDAALHAVTATALYQWALDQRWCAGSLLIEATAGEIIIVPDEGDTRWCRKWRRIQSCSSTRTGRHVAHKTLPSDPHGLLVMDGRNAHAFAAAPPQPRAERYRG